MAAKVSSYQLGLPSYGDSKLKKGKNCKKMIDCLAIFTPGLW